MTIYVKIVNLNPKKYPCEKQGGRYELILDPGAHPMDILSLFGIEYDPALVCAINGNIAEWTDELTEGSELMCMPVLYGG